MSLYAAGMTTKDISEQIKNLYDVDISADMVSNITNRIIPLVSEWQNRPAIVHLPADMKSQQTYAHTFW